MGVWQLGGYGLHYDQTNPGLLSHYSEVLPGWQMADVIGSPYAITNYTCNSQLGLDQDILDLKQRVNKLGMKLGLDFVPNHSAVDCPFVTSNPEYYIRAPNGTNPPYNSNYYLPSGIAYGSASGASGGAGWQDTAQFNCLLSSFSFFESFLTCLLEIGIQD